MVFPVQSSAVSPITPSENLPLPEPPQPKNATEIREGITELVSPISSRQVPQAIGQGVDENAAQPVSGQIVDLSTNQKVKDTPIQTLDETTKKADEEEKDFREKVDTIAHGQHN